MQRADSIAPTAPIASRSLPATDSEKARRLLEKAEKACLITNSLALTPGLTCDVEIEHDKGLAAGAL
jgi:hypothetical protein